MHRFLSAAAVPLLAAAALLPSHASAQRTWRRGPAVWASRARAALNPLRGTRWSTHRNNLGDPRFVGLDYVTLFVATRGSTEASDVRYQQFGTDVAAANNPAPGGPDGGLYAVLPSGMVAKLFPLDVHDAAPGLIDTPVGELEKGAVVEPNVSEDGRRVYFAWFHDQTWKRNGGGWLSQELAYKGADLYSIDLSPLLADPSVDPSTLPIQRLTNKAYEGPARQNVRETHNARSARAMNPNTPGFASEVHGTCNMHMIEVRTERGLQAVFVSDRTRNTNSNVPAALANHRFDIYTADLLKDGSLGRTRKLSYATTTSALSPTVLRDGFAFSYQASTENFRRWDIQTMTSSGHWDALLGYGQKDLLYHLGTLVTTKDAGAPVDHFVAVKYYNRNNGGFGQLQRIALTDAGIYERALVDSIAQESNQRTELLSLGVTEQDLPSGKVDRDGEAVYVGKLTTPRAGRMGGEYLASYTPTSANRWRPDEEGATGRFAAYIAYRPDLAPFQPERPFDPATGEGLGIVIDDRLDEYNLLWPTPVLSFEDRHGTPTQAVSPPLADPASTVLRGEPYADIGTSALWNTDLRPYDCLRGTGPSPYDPNSLSTRERLALDQSVEGLRYVQDPANPCGELLPETVLGVRINLTSSGTNWRARANPTYDSDVTLGGGAGSVTELVRSIGVYDVTLENASDQSFLARIPSDVPFDLQLLDRRYGMKLVDTRSWHALLPRESRVDCGGCHQHGDGLRLPFGGTEASMRAPLDLTRRTSVYTYDETCQPVLSWTADATAGVPEWQADVWPGLLQNCGACHDATVSTDTQALVAFDFVDEESAYEVIRERSYASSVQGALGSQLFWAAYGKRTDGRNNNEPLFQPNYASGDWGFKFSTVHRTNPGLCSSGDAARTAWVYALGYWIDSHMPRQRTGGSFGYDLDRFHPTVDFAYTRAVPGEIRVGVWDDRSAMTVAIYHDDVLVETFTGLGNESILVGDGGLGPASIVRVVVTDAAGNRQFKEKTIAELDSEG